jgi:hypothetical protein
MKFCAERSAAGAALTVDQSSRWSSACNKPDTTQYGWHKASMGVGTEEGAFVISAGQCKAVQCWGRYEDSIREVYIVPYTPKGRYSSTGNATVKQSSELICRITARRTCNSHVRHIQRSPQLLLRPAGHALFMAALSAVSSMLFMSSRPLQGLHTAVPDLAIWPRK